VTYAADVKPIIDLRCAGCHNALTRNGAVDLSTKALVQQYASNGKLVGTMSRAPGFVPMPPSGPKAPDCEIAKIRAWINGGFR
jgi:cytochrome c5